MASTWHVCISILFYTWIISWGKVLVHWFFSYRILFDIVSMPQNITDTGPLWRPALELNGLPCVKFYFTLLYFSQSSVCGQCKVCKNAKNANIQRVVHKIRACLHGGHPAHGANRATQAGLTSHMFLSKMHWSVYKLDRVACLPRAPCLLVQGTQLGGVAFCHINGSSQAISANRGEINCENMVVRSEYIRSYHLPVLSAK